MTTDKKQRPNTGEWRGVFIAALRNSANVRAACQQAGVSRAMAYKARSEYRRFAAQWDEALSDAVDYLAGEAWRRASVSDTLLIYLLKIHGGAFWRQDGHSRVDVTFEVREETERLARAKGLTEAETASAVEEAVRLATGG